MSPTSTAPTPYLDSAGTYHSAGWPGVIPVKPNAKKPHVSGFHGRAGAWTSDVQIGEWGRLFPDANIGLRLQDGVLGMDKDFYRSVSGARGFSDLVDAFGDLPPTWRSTSRASDAYDPGSGIDYYRVPTGRRWPGKPAGDVDIICHYMRYAVVPPSVHPEGRKYQWISPQGELTDQIPHPEDLAWLPDAWCDGLTALAAVEGTPEDVDEFLADLGDDETDDEVAEIVSRFEKALADAGDADVHTQARDAVWDLVKAGANGASGVPTALATTESLFLTAKAGDTQAGSEWNRLVTGAVAKLRPADLSFELDADEMAAFDRIVGRLRAEPVAIETSADPFGDRLIGRRGLAALPNPEPLIADTIDRRTVALLAGYHGTGKSFVALGWAASVATGTPWMGRPVQKGRVLYIVGEGAHGIDGRLSAWERASGVQIDDDALRTYPAAVQIADPAALGALLAHVESTDYALVILDTVARSAVGLDENSARDMGVFIDAADRIKRATGSGTVLLVHHTGKDRTTVRGSSALEAAMDTVYTTEGDPMVIRLRRTKRKDGPMEDAHTLRLVGVGDSCVLESLDSAVQQKVSDTDLEARAWLALAGVFHVRHFTRTEAVTVLVDPEHANLSRATAYRAITRLGTAGVLRNESTTSTPRFLLDPAAASKAGFPECLPLLPSTTTGFDLDGVSSTV